ncbi:MAG: hypothetical protein AB1324_07450 [Candidatus Micrarchaeota archaeon]
MVDRSRELQHDKANGGNEEKASPRSKFSKWKAVVAGGALALAVSCGDQTIDNYVPIPPVASTDGGATTDGGHAGDSGMDGGVTDGGQDVDGGASGDGGSDGGTCTPPSAPVCAIATVPPTTVNVGTVFVVGDYRIRLDNTDESGGEQRALVDVLDSCDGVIVNNHPIPEGQTVTFAVMGTDIEIDVTAENVTVTVPKSAKMSVNVRCTGTTDGGPTTDGGTETDGGSGSGGDGGSGGSDGGSGTGGDGGMAGTDGGTTTDGGSGTGGDGGTGGSDGGVVTDGGTETDGGSTTDGGSGTGGDGGMGGSDGGTTTDGGTETDGGSGTGGDGGMAGSDGGVVTDGGTTDGGDGGVVCGTTGTFLGTLHKNDSDATEVGMYAFTYTGKNGAGAALISVTMCGTGTPVADLVCPPGVDTTHDVGADGMRITVHPNVIGVGSVNATINVAALGP